MDSLDDLDSMLNASESSRILDKRREIRETEEELDAQRQVYDTKVVSMSQREEALEARRRELHQNLVKFNKLIADNESKRSRALRKVQDEIVATQGKAREVKELQLKVRDILEEKSNAEEEIRRISKFFSYLDAVCRAHADDFNDIRDVLNRMSILKRTEEGLFERKKRLKDDLSMLWQQLDQLKKAHFNRQLSANTELGKLQAGLESAEMHARQVQRDRDSSLHYQRHVKHTLASAVMSVQNIFIRVCDRSNMVQNRSEKNVIVQLSVVEKFIVDFKSIVLSAHASLRAASVMGFTASTAGTTTPTPTPSAGAPGTPVPGPPATAH